MIQLTRVKVSAIEALSLRSAAAASREPETTYIAIAALGLSCRAESDWPTIALEEGWTAYGRRVLSYLRLQGVPDAEIRTWSVGAFRALPDTDVSKQVIDDVSSFFGIRLGSEPVSGSPTDTSGMLSEVST